MPPAGITPSAALFLPWRSSPYWPMVSGNARHSVLECCQRLNNPISERQEGWTIRDQRHIWQFVEATMDDPEVIKSCRCHKRRDPRIQETQTQPKDSRQQSKRHNSRSQRNHAMRRINMVGTRSH